MPVNKFARSLKYTNIINRIRKEKKKEGDIWYLYLNWTFKVSFQWHLLVDSAMKPFRRTQLNPGLGEILHHQGVCLRYLLQTIGFQHFTMFQLVITENGNLMKK